jgi:hypothetical protein
VMLEMDEVPCEQPTPCLHQLIQIVAPRNPAQSCPSRSPARWPAGCRSSA